MSLHIATIAKDEQIKAVVRLIASGFLCLYQGARPRDPDTVVQDARRIAQLPIGIDACAVHPDGRAIIGPVTALADRPGIVTWFRVTSAQGVPVLDGGVGVQGRDEGKDAVDLLLTRVDLLAGDLAVVHELILFAPRDDQDGAS